MVSYPDKEKYTPRDAVFTQTERRKLKPLKTKKNFSEVGHNHPYQLQSNGIIHSKTPSEYKNIHPIELDLSGDSVRRKEFNREINIPIDSGRI